MKKYKSHFLIVIVLVLGCKAKVDSTAVSKPQDDERPKPNVVLILTDDLGWQDVKSYDIDAPSPYETPNIDALAEKGVQFWQAYSPAPTCAPSRCAIMSGNHPARAQKTHVVGGAPPSVYNNKKANRLMDPWYSGRMPEDELTIARVLQQNKYITGHVGKWHMAINHKAYPQPEDQGFDFTASDRGATKRRANRLQNFATTDASDPYRLDENGFPYHQNSEDALTFLQKNKENPFFLYYATWLVHAPIHTRSEALLKKYCEKLGVAYPTDPNKWPLEGQNNPYYCAMVEMLDYYVGKVINYLETTDDPRWPGHKLIENTYLIFTSDNGGMERAHGDIITDNYPLDKGKINAKEGGTRVPLLIAGPGIKKDVESDVMINGLDFYPTILSLLNIEKPLDKNLDGSDLSSLLLTDPTDPTLVKDNNGKQRETMMWHFPHSSYQSTLRIGDYKLIRNYDHQGTSKPQFELYQLYDSSKGKQQRVDIEESHNLANQLPELTKTMNDSLTQMLTEMKASYPYYNPYFKGDDLLGKENVPTVLSHSKNRDEVTFIVKQNGAKIKQANLIYTLNGGARYEEWFRLSADVKFNGTVKVKLPKGTTHYVLNIIDVNNFLVSYPEMPTEKKARKGNYASKALIN